MQSPKKYRQYTPIMHEMIQLQKNLAKWKLENPDHAVINYKENIRTGKAYIRWCKDNLGPFLVNWAYMGKKLYIKNPEMHTLLILSMDDYEKR